MAMSVRSVVAIVVSFIVIGVVLPLGLGYIATFGDAQITLPNGSSAVLSDVIDPTIITLVEVLLPILAVIGIIMTYVAYKNF